MVLTAGFVINYRFEQRKYTFVKLCSFIFFLMGGFLLWIHLGDKCSEATEDWKARARDLQGLSLQ